MSVHVVLVRPESPANVGAVARVVRNTGLDSLRLVAPGDWRTVECWRTAWGSQDVLEQAAVLPDLQAAVADAHLVFAFSGRRERGAAILDVREAAAEVVRRRDETTCLVFGPEAAGLSQDELSRCGARVLIPAHHAQPSLNLSHAVMVAAYEVFRARASEAPSPRCATHEDKAALLDQLRAGLLSIGALPAANTERYFRDWQAMFARALLTPKEVRLLEHMARKMARAGKGESTG
ncbi:MAG TPA: TrmH family RNA methyltransferase [Vicinamibacteria bacterium]|nr:TrmH family RNA methyltransferase [Vicinamibacteria bacterium]